MRLSVAGGESQPQLGAEDVKVLLHHNDAATRAAVVRKISYVYHYASLSRKERETAVQIFRMILQDKSPLVRRTMAEVLKSCLHAPVDIIHALADDGEDEVAAPVLQHSELLSESDLLTIVEATEAVLKLLAVAGRYQVPEKLSAALVDKKQPRVALAVVENPGARISGPLYLTIANDYGLQPGLLPALKQRNPLPLAAIARVGEVQKQALANDNRDAVVREEGASDGAASSIRRNRGPEHSLGWGGSPMLTGYKVATGEIRHYYHAFASLPAKPGNYAYERLTEEMNGMLRLNGFSLLVSLMLGHEGFFTHALAMKLRLPLMKAEEICLHPYSPLFSVMCENARLVAPQVLMAQWLLTETRDILKHGGAPGQAVAVKLLPRLEAAIRDGGLKDEMHLREIVGYLAQID